MTLKNIVSLIAFFTLLSCGAESTLPTRPNMVIVLADDLGYGDLGCYGHPVIKTPYLDNFAKQGVKLTDCYAASPNCSPARAGMLTGRMPYRVGLYDFVRGNSPMHLLEDEVTVAEMLKDAGYQTMFVGKWHLGNFDKNKKVPTPGDHGFDYWLAGVKNFDKDPKDLILNGERVGPLEGIQCEVVVDECVDWLTHKRDKSKPFCMFVWLNEPHTPVRADEEFINMYPAESAAADALPLGGEQVINAKKKQKAAPYLLWLCDSDGS